ncbi:hypothetical protein ASC94_06770 [Massilia sp. Root418]|uniref:tetratricopeptide repeat protein n=1 Tax=Massilia sp. Root418 TaxID=1736532 RepID=UPI0006F7AD2E|nr:tetratricopeptide repeat protein [Massilia sp. Root418]KQW96543.1 hypothetical protein ASC94_06770 [Massilia sp. Root418]
MIKRLHALLCAMMLAGSSAHAAEAEDLYLRALQAISDGRQTEAGQILAQMTAQGPQNAGEWLDLAMLHCALGNQRQAEALFRDVEQRFNPGAGIMDIIEQQRKGGCRGPKALSQWALAVARGTDSNVNQGASSQFYTPENGKPLELLPEYLPRSDQYSALTGDYLRELGQNGDVGFVQLQLRRHDSLSSYNTAALLVGAEHPWRWGRWRLRGTATLGALTLGGRLYQEQGLLQVRATPPWKLPERLELSLQAGMGYTTYKTLSEFDGGTAELRAVLSYRGEPTQAQFSAGYVHDHASGNRPGGDRDGWSARLGVQRPLFGPLKGEFELNRNHWAGQQPYSPGLIDTVRRQAITSARATVVYPLTRDQALHLEWRVTNNRDNVSLFQYRARQLQLSWHMYGW